MCIIYQKSWAISLNKIFEVLFKKYNRKILLNNIKQKKYGEKSIIKENKVSNI